MATDMKYYKDLLAGVAGANLGADEQGGYR